jgi:hypothetical protein
LPADHEAIPVELAGRSFDGIPSHLKYGSNAGFSEMARIWPKPKMIEHRYVTANGLRFHVATAGPPDGPLVILLHGFPEFWYGWRHQIEPLANAGFEVWVPDQRGYNLSDNPRIRQLLPQQPRIHLSVRDDEGWFKAKFPEGVDELYFRDIGTIEDIERLKALYELFAEVLEHLCKIGSAIEHDPGVAL